MKEYNFNTDLALSHRYEIKFAEWLKSKGMQDIDCAPQDKVFHDWDIKTTHDTYEIKYDRWFARTGNVIVETHSNLDTDSLGWFYTTKAKWLIVYYTDNLFYGMSMEHLRDVFYNTPQIWRKVKIDQGNYFTVCWVAPIEYFSLVKHGDDRK